MRASQPGHTRILLQCSRVTTGTAGRVRLSSMRVRADHAIVNTLTIVSGLLVLLLLKGRRQAGAFRLSVVGCCAGRFSRRPRCWSTFRSTPRSLPPGRFNFLPAASSLEGARAERGVRQLAWIRPRTGRRFGTAGTFSHYPDGLALTALICLLLAALTPQHPPNAGPWTDLDHGR